MNAPRENPPKRTAGETVKDLRRLRAVRMARRFAALVVVPTFLATIYFGFIASPQYESVSLFTIHSSDGGMQLSALMGMMPGSNGARDTAVVREYVLSRDMLDLLIRDEGFVEHFSDTDKDYVSRLASDASSEDIFDYYLSRVNVEHDELGSVLTLKVRGFSAEKASSIALAILRAAEAKVNEMDAAARDDSIALARAEVDRAEERLSAARVAILEAQRDEHELSPMASAQALLALRSGIEAQLAAARAELNALLSSMQPSAPRVVAQRQKVNALAGQVAQQSRRMTGEGDEGLSSSIAEFEPLAVEKEIAQTTYESAVRALEIARIDATRQHRYLVKISSPSKPSEQTHPVAWKGVLVTFLFCFAMLGIGSLLVASVREHAHV